MPVFLLPMAAPLTKIMEKKTLTLELQSFQGQGWSTHPFLIIA